ncbi:ShlB/FhaC/HecB family hemolysin secretion/activation protein [Sphaerotilus montanus]|uniref:ShlB/FhaC/HecB family hemolysin secretion/activation protein n=1 Tax=Sphaerotilus montanus TaxID=522889 RepID=UPI003FA29892
MLTTPTTPPARPAREDMLMLLSHGRALALGAFLGFGGWSVAAWSATELQGPTPVEPRSSPPEVVPLPPEKPGHPVRNADEGARVVVTSVLLEGCRILSCDELRAGLQPWPAGPVGLAEIEGLAQNVEDRYKRAGYPFTQVIVPPQRISDGQVTLRVIEGVLGKATIQSKDPKAAGAQPFLDQGLPVGEPIGEKKLSRTMLLIDDQPGFRVHPLIRPGEKPGQGNLEVDVDRVNRFSGEVGLDNIGNRSTGRNRLHGSVAANSPFRFGDRIAVDAMATDQHMALGSVSYDAPLGAQGWRGQAGVSRTSYRLAGDFEALGSSGYADTTSLKLSHPLLRSQVSNLLVSATLQQKNLHDRYESVGLERDKSSHQIVLATQFDHRDRILDGGVTYGLASLTFGHLSLDAATALSDATTARTAGDFGKINLDVARMQGLVGPFSAYARVSAQWAMGNLDSSEKYGLGGFTGVRAYPMGEATGDAGWLGQFELRWSSGATTGFVFADAGQMVVNRQAWDDASSTRRALAGAGVGMRWVNKGWSLESTLARRVKGGAAQSETGGGAWRWFVTLSRRFEH